ncbi:DUF397 domain-containing protein [Streptomyces sp. LP05-1]|uniref:DUF397 domain-containing protein n=1 Tax=Streptomyces pyxinae TaxID=2970734 RepID=A0ABT2CIR4_9ACTN|nr:DUF397 domain-containing protein [Streptomyces sp. LP05-1]MCS0636992.1 DUF397 domain-containing protein [Streptomyces sp. LP05-1]
MSDALLVSRTGWVKSSYSGPEGGNCVEWAPRSAATTGLVPVRDSKVAAGPTLAVAAGAWAAFVGMVRR